MNTIVKVLKAGDSLYDSVNDSANTGAQYIVKDIVGAGVLTDQQQKDIGEAVLAACLMAVVKTMAYQEFIQFQISQNNADGVKH